MKRIERFSLSEDMIIRTERGSNRNIENWELVTFCVGFLTASYNLSIIGSVSTLIIPSTDSSWGSSVLVYSALAGASLGSILFGILGDCYGRDKMLQITCLINILSSICSACVPVMNEIWWVISICRFCVGVGTGGEYPLLSALVAEKSSEINRGKMVAIMFSMQGFGALLAPVSVWAMLSSNVPPDWTWRLALAFGVVPLVMTLSPRFLLLPSDLFEKAKNTRFLDANGYDWAGTFSEVFFKKKTMKTLFATSSTWLLFDITFYGTGLFKEETIMRVLGKPYVGNGILASIIIATIALPGYWFAIFLMDWLGRRKLQLAGFFLVSVTYGMLAIFFSSFDQVPVLFIVMLGLTFFFSNIGPNTTTFVISCESFVTEVRTTCTGISSAFAKIGAAIGAATLSPLGASWGYEWAFGTCALIAMVAFFITLFYTEDSTGSPLKKFTEEDSDSESSSVDIVTVESQENWYPDSN